jgi:hypothetical protein
VMGHEAAAAPGGQYRRDGALGTRQHL